MTLLRTDFHIAYLGGGSRGWAWDLFGDLALEPCLSGEVRLYDIDAASARGNEIIGNRLSERDDVPGKWRYRAVEDLAQALEGADAVVISILPGTLRDMALDIEIPESYGVFQSVGDTTGPGGDIRTLRTVPPLFRFGLEIGKSCPDALVINLTNPMAASMEALYLAFPAIRAVGLCHEADHARDVLAAICSEEANRRVESEEVEMVIAGVNHFTWLVDARYDALSLKERLGDFIMRHPDGFLERTDDDWARSPFCSRNLVKFDLFRRFGSLPAAGDRHIAEFMTPVYLKDLETIHRFGFQLTPVSWRKNHSLELLARSHRLITGKESMKPHPSGERLVDLLQCHAGLRSIRINLNLPNRGRIKGMQDHAIVETYVGFSQSGIKAEPSVHLPSAVLALVSAHAVKTGRLVAAALAQDEEEARKAFLTDPLLDGISKSSASEMFDRMIESTRHLLPGWPSSGGKVG